jgi:hypothetical protein
MPCPETPKKRPETTEPRTEAARLRLQRAAQADQLSPALVREAQASLASALSLSDLLLGRRA